MNTKKSRFRERLKIAISNLKGIPIITDLSSWRKQIIRIRNFNLSGLCERDLAQEAQNVRNRVRPGLKTDQEYFFALVLEACRRTLGIEPFDVQLIAALAMAENRLAEMGTGEGKTLAAVFPAAWHALSGNGVHILTANEYLADRDAAWMGPVYRLLGISVGAVCEMDSAAAKKKAYLADVTYTTVRQAGFDFLADQFVFSPEDCLHRSGAPAGFALIDEADFIMIDEARIPMVLAGRDDEDPFDPFLADRLVSSLAMNDDFTIDRRGRRCFLNDQGKKKVCAAAGLDIENDEETFHMTAAANVALHARHLLQKDIDYIIRQDRIELVDENTGRIANRRKWPYGIQAALEIKEKLPVRERGAIHNSITVQHFVDLYPSISAMTATAVPAAVEFRTFYNLPVVIIPPNRPSRLLHYPDKIFRTVRARNNAVIQLVLGLHRSTQPVLIGTASVRESEQLSALLDSYRISHNVLNAVHDAEEARIIAEAGALSAVTISTNMAGRGTDIRLGGADGARYEEVKTLGGLFILSLNKNESRRIDDQLRGRAGRQGDPGTTCFFISLEDNLVRKYAITDFIPGEYLHNDSDEEIPDRRVATEINRAQEIIEAEHFAMRKTLRKYSMLIEKQRKIIASVRREALFNHEFPEELITRCRQQIDDAPDFALAEQVLVRVFLSCLDDFWKDHLLKSELLRDGLGWRRLAGKEPLLEFIRDTTDSFQSGLPGIIRRTVNEFHSIDPVEYSKTLTDKRYNTPSSTWTYTVNDEAMPGFRLSLAGMPFAAQLAGAFPVMIKAAGTALAALFRKREK
ncbi:MAG: hypothetical protein JW874_06140 [Spirochaetales bacterium]|nr:hypothetical protein [Spirochaetales bacterium]